LTSLFVLVAAIGCGVADTPELATDSGPKWGDQDYPVRPLIINTPSIVEIKGLRDDLAIMPELSEDGSYYLVFVGSDLPERFNTWFVLKVRKDGSVFREILNPESGKYEWVPDQGSPD
jgi:hypothetical protein